MPCNRFASLDILHAQRAVRDGDGSGRLPFVLPGAETRHVRDRPVDLRHVTLDLALDFEARRVSGSVTHLLAPLRPGVRHVEIDAREMEIEDVRIGSTRAAFRYDGRRVVVDAGKPLREGRAVKLFIRYSCSPRRGFYFIAPDDEHPDRVVHGWSQGQDEDSHWWWPTVDAPNEKVTTELTARVPKGFVALSNGRLVEHVTKGKHEIWHWKQLIPHVPYLVTLAAGPFEKIEQAGRVPMTTWFLPGRKADAQRCVKDTPRMLELFSDVTGVPYPWEKYDQVFVQDFIFGGMENTTATTLTDLVLHDRRAALDYTCEELISHELAHQWWGDLITCRDWSQAWLNEGFATYFEVVWKEHARGEEEGWVLRKQMREDYLEEDGKEYRRPIACSVYDDPIELFDRHLYEKGACVLGMLRHALGDDLFWRSLRDYIAAHREGSVETVDLRRAVERASGRAFDRFFEQWIASAGHPELEIATSWSDERSELTLTIEQKQEGKDTPECFELALDVRLLMGDGSRAAWKEGRACVTRRRQSFVFPLESAPRAVVLDPWEEVLKTVSWDRPIAELEATIEHAPWAPPRAEACEALGKDGSARAVRALEQVLRQDAFWAVRAAAAEALGEIRSDAALDALLAHVAQPHPKVRRAVMAALGACRDIRASQALQEILERGDASYFVEAEAATSLGRVGRLDAIRALREALKRKEPGWNEVVRCGVIDGIGRLEVDQRSEAITLVLPFADPSCFVRLRLASVRALGRLGEGDARVRERLERLLEDSDFRVVIAACEALAQAGAVLSRSALARAADSALDGRVRRSAREAARRLSHRDEALARRVETDIESMSQRLRKLRERLDAVESRPA